MEETRKESRGKSRVGLECSLSHLLFCNATSAHWTGSPSRTCDCACDIRNFTSTAAIETEQSRSRALRIVLCATRHACAACNYIAVCRTVVTVAPVFFRHRVENQLMLSVNVNVNNQSNFELKTKSVQLRSLFVNNKNSLQTSDIR